MTMQKINLAKMSSFGHNLRENDECHKVVSKISCEHNLGANCRISLRF